MHRTHLHLIVVSLAVLCDVGYAGPDWTEPPNQDAGSLPGSAQLPFGPAGALRSISGNLNPVLGAARAGVDFEDVYRITICDPVLFCAKASANFDSQVWLFNADGFGILGNDEGNGNQGVVFPPANDGTHLTVAAPGQYLIAISGFNNDPIGIGPLGTGLIFNQQTREERSGPDGQGGQSPLSAWTGDGAIGHYVLRLEGVAFPGDTCTNGPYVQNPCIPAASQWGLAALLLSVLCGATIMTSRKATAGE